MSADEPSADWSKAAVLERLESADTDKPGLQAFLGRDVPSAEVESVARAIVDAASGTEGARLGPVMRLAKSFAVHGDLAVLRRIAEDPRVATITPTTVEDILPKPVVE